MAPVAVAFLLPASIIMEEDVLGITIQLAREDSTIVWLLLFNSALAYFVNLTNFLVTKHTSALTLQVIIVSLLLFYIRFNLFDISSVLIKRIAHSKLTCDAKNHE
jgi:hypothetical protein